MGVGIVLLAASLGAGGHLSATSSQAPLLLRNPAIGPDSIVFSFAGDLWSVPRNGGRAGRLTVSPGVETDAAFSPDGKWIAFSGTYDGNPDAYVIPASGGTPRRLTYFPGPDGVAGWSPDGKSVLVLSTRGGYLPIPKIYKVPAQGGVAEMLPFPRVREGSLSPDGARLAYSPGFQFQEAWKRYRGGQTYPIWIGQLADSKVKEIPRNNSNDKNPMWVGNSVYFISDRNAGIFGLFRYDVASNKVSEVVKGEGMDIKSATAGFGAIAYEKFGSLRVYDLETKTDKEVPVEIDGDFAEVRPQFKTAGPSNLSISPSGARVAVEARGHVVTVPAAKGDPRDLTPEPGVANRYPAWSPDGKTLAYYSDKGGEYKLVLRNSNSDESRTVELGEAPGYYYQPVWSPDSKRIGYWDNKHNLWSLDVASGVSTKIDTATYEDPTREANIAWSPDSQWMVWSRDLDTQFNAVFLYSFEQKKKVQVTDGLSDAKFPAFDNGGKYLYFIASTDTASSTAWLDLSVLAFQNKTSSVYCAVLKADEPDPLKPESDEEGVAPAKPAESKFGIDLEGLDQRVVTLPVPARNYVALKAGTPGSVLLLHTGLTPTTPTPAPVALTKFDFASKANMPLANNVQAIDVTPKGDKMLLIVGGQALIASTMAPPPPGAGAISLNLDVRIDPRAEWRQMFHEALRVQRDFFYDPNLHGQDVKKLAARYEPYLENLSSRADLNYILEDMLGEISVGHMYISGGDIPGVRGPGGGLLGADYVLEANRYKLSKVLTGESWNPGTRAPLTQPGVAAKVGEFILAIDGKELYAKDDIYQALEGKAGKQIKVKIGPNADGTGSREVVVVPVGSESGLRYLAWREDNRRTVAKLSGGKLGYVHVPDTNLGGWNGFNRFYYSQKDRDGLIIDERFNGGGSVDDYMVDQMIRPMRSMWTARYGKDFASPASQHFGPKVMIIDQYAGSGGDYFPWHFREAKAGPIVGKRTWGGLVGILIFPQLVDGGSVTSPNIAFYNPDGKWEIENYGVPPDVEVEYDPFLWRQGRDAQLEKAVEVAMERLKTWKKPEIKKPAYPNKSKLPG